MQPVHNRSMKLDLHTHCLEAFGLYGHALPTTEIVRKIVTKVKDRGLDGIAITEHSDRHRAFLVKDLVERSFNNEILIIPGQEVTRFGLHVVELYLPNDSIFRFLPHPGYPSARWWDEHLNGIHGIEIENGNYDIDQSKVRAVEQRHGLLLLSNSDAHDLDDIGIYYNVIDIEELCSRGELRQERM